MFVVSLHHIDFQAVTYGTRQVHKVDCDWSCYLSTTLEIRSCCADQLVQQRWCESWRWIAL